MKQFQISYFSNRQCCTAAGNQIPCSGPLQRGYSLLEMTAIVLILGIVAAITLPSMVSTDPAKLDLAAQEFADAIRFARSEAMRQGKPVGFRQQNTQKRIRVYNLDTGTSPWTLVYDIYHPISKKIYDIQLDEHPFAYAETVSNVRLFKGSCTTSRNVYFDESGIARCADPETILLESFDITLSHGDTSRMVMLDGPSGLVKIQ